MTDILGYATPQTPTGIGFHFETFDSYIAQAERNTDADGNVITQYDIRVVTGAEINRRLAQAWDVTQASLRGFMTAVTTWSDPDKRALIIAVTEGHTFDPNTVTPKQFDIQIYPVSTLRELAILFVHQGQYGDIAPPIAPYIHYEAIADDLRAHYGEIIIAGQDIVYGKPNISNTPNQNLH